MQQAAYFRQHEQCGVVCQLCPRECIINEGKNGFCRVRSNTAGVLYANNYGSCTACSLDPIEKKPLYHFYPGSYILSLGSWGCNFTCQFCQNWHIAQKTPETVEMSPREATSKAVKATKIDNRNIGLAYTYSEPSVWYEYVLATAKLLKAEGLKNVLITNGFINKEPLLELLPFIDAVNIDVKAFNDDYYRNICGGQLSDVKKTVELAINLAHVEVTCLVVPGGNDDLEELAALTKWLAELNKDIPLHFSRYFPNYKMTNPPTPVTTLEAAYRVARQKLNYVYLGNVEGNGNTYCPGCGKLVIDRQCLRSYLTEENQCSGCGKNIKLAGKPVFK
ncbi:MAG: pflA 2 [Firmicutes bacterium]|nr:pflA 2 [Bacillota bacterium]